MTHIMNDGERWAAANLPPKPDRMPVDLIKAAKVEKRVLTVFITVLAVAAAVGCLLTGMGML